MSIARTPVIDAFILARTSRLRKVCARWFLPAGRIAKPGAADANHRQLGRLQVRGNPPIRGCQVGFGASGEGSATESLYGLISRRPEASARPGLPSPGRRRAPFVVNSHEVVHQCGTTVVIVLNPRTGRINCLSYGNVLKHALALQLRIRRDAEYSATAMCELRAVVAKRLPETIDDMRAWFADRIEQLRKPMRASGTNMWAAYWTQDARPRDEDFCRDRLIEHISGQLPRSMRFEPEARMPLGKRADIALTRNALEAAIGVDVRVDERCARRHRGVSDRLDQWASTPHGFAECSSRCPYLHARAV